MGIFIRGIPSTTTREELKDKFGSYGNVVTVTIVPSRTHETYTAYVDFDSETAAQKVGSGFVLFGLLGGHLRAQQDACDIYSLC